MYWERLHKLQSLLSSYSIDSLLVSDYYNILYFVGFAGLSPDEREAYLFITTDTVYFFTDERYLTKKLKAQMSKLKTIPRLITLEKSIMAHLQELAKENNIENIGFEAEDLKYGEYEL